MCESHFHIKYAPRYDLDIYIFLFRELGQQYLENVFIYDQCNEK